MREEWLKLRQRLLFKTPVELFATDCKIIRDMYDAEFKTAAESRKSEIINILYELTIDIQSYLTSWHLQKKGAAIKVSDAELLDQSKKNKELLYSWGSKSKGEDIDKEVNIINSSNLKKMSILSDENHLNNRWGNDYASGLAEAMRKGAVLATTNPPIINNERKENPVLWDNVRRKLKKETMNLEGEKLASLMTKQVVLKNCRELRPIFEASEGSYGYLSLQISPENSTDSNKMVEEVEIIYDELKRDLEGIPNVVFKLPGTKASVAAAKRLTAKGIGVNITVSFSVDQMLAFAEAIEGGTAKVSFVVMMTGRLDDPIRDELLSAGVENAEEIARWASAAVVRKAYGLLYLEKRFKKSAILVASLRGPWNILNAITHGEAPIFITSFPDKTIEFDSINRELLSNIQKDIPEHVLDGLMKSSIFRKAYQPGSMSDSDFDTFHPVVVTLDAFRKSYRELVEYMDCREE